MAIPVVSGALNGWMKKRTIRIVTKTVTNHKVVEGFVDHVVLLNIQPMPSEKVNRKPEEQRSWKWWSIWMKKAPALKIDDVIVIDGIKYRIEVVNNWEEAGYQSYEAVQDIR